MSRKGQEPSTQEKSSPKAGQKAADRELTLPYEFSEV